MSLRSVHLNMLIILFILPAALFAQTAPEGAGNQKSLLFTAGLGANLGSDFEGIGGGAMLSLTSGNMLYSLRVINLERWSGVHPATSVEEKWKDFTDAAVMFGVYKKQKLYFISAQTGIGLASWKREMMSIDNRKTSISLPAGVQAFVTPLPFMGVGIYGFGAVNNVKSISGILIMVRFGKLW